MRFHIVGVPECDLGFTEFVQRQQYHVQPCPRSLSMWDFSLFAFPKDISHQNEVK